MGAWKTAAGIAVLLAVGAPLSTALAAVPKTAYVAGTMYVSSETSPSEGTSPSVEPSLPPEPDTSWIARYRGRMVRRIRLHRGEKLVALTFDDGPNARTKAFVNVLNAYGVKGTFFATWLRSKCAGMGTANRDVLAHGHELANHTKRHHMLTGSYPLSIYEILGAERLLLRQTGRKTTWVRAMGGGVNAAGLRATKDTGHLYAQWSLDSGDTRRRYTAPHVIYHNVVDHVRPGEVILLHVTHPESLAALPGIIRELKRRGYKMVTMSELAAHGRPW